MGREDTSTWSTMLRQMLVPLVVLIIVILQSILYLSLLSPRTGYADYDDALIEFGVAIIAYLLIILFGRSIQKRPARIPLQLGWTIIIIVVVHSGLIQLVDLFYPYSVNILTMGIQFFQDTLTISLGLAASLSFIGVYNWVADTSARERHFHSVVDAMPVGVAVTDLNTRVTLYNEELTQILDLEGDQIFNAQLFDLLRVEAVSSIDLRKATSGAPFQVDILREYDEASKKYLSLTLVPNKDKNGSITGHIAVVTDMTTRRMTEEDREQQRRVIDLYASLLSHDVGNDLQAVLGYIETALLIIDTNPAKARAMFESAHAAGERMSNLIKTFRIELTPSHIQIVPMLREFAEQAEKVSLGLRVSVHEESGVTNLRSAGGSLLPIAINNLLRNTAQHAGDNSVVKIEVFRVDNDLIILISDNGPGISEESRSNIFNRGDRSRESGLGLYLTRQIIIACGGSIELVDSTDSVGATFRITLPILE
ncbi:MAG: ATP-binding protein [Candidatus Thorarchaeota archaeon]